MITSLSGPEEKENPAGQNTESPSNANFNEWFKAEASVLRQFFRLLISLVPLSIIATLLGKEISGNFIKDFTVQEGLLVSIVLQFIFMSFLLWRMLLKINGDRSAAWLSAPDKLKSDSKKMERFLDALNFKSRNRSHNGRQQELKKNIVSAIKSENHFKYAWLSVWLIWLLIYIVKGVAIFGLMNPGSVNELLIENLYNMLVCAQIIGFACCYFFLTNKDDREIAESPKVNWHIFVLLFVVLAMCVCISVTSHFHEFEKHRIMTGLFLLKILRNTMVSTFFALMVVKLLAEDLRSPFWIRLSVFLYIATIPLFVIFSDMPELKDYLLLNGTGDNGKVFYPGDLKIIIDNVELILYNVAWFFKFCIFLFVAWLIEKDHLLFYFLRFRESNNEVIKDRKTIDELLKYEETDANGPES